MKLFFLGLALALLALSGCKDDSWDQLLKANEIEYHYTIKETDSEVVITGRIVVLNSNHEAQISGFLLFDRSTVSNFKNIEVESGDGHRFQASELLSGYEDRLWFLPVNKSDLIFKVIFLKNKKYTIKITNWRIVLSNYRNNDHTNNDYAVKKINYLITSPNESQ